MKRFVISFKQPSIKIPRSFVMVFLVVAALGFMDATYLAAKHYLGEPPPCSILQGCEEVTLSAYSQFLGVPVALGGAVYYLAMIIVCIAYLDTHWRLFEFLMTRVTAFGFLASVYFVYLQLFVIHAICLWCMFSAVTSTLLFVLGLMAHFRWERKKEKEIISSV